jgi:hypothetical protein
VESLFRDYFCCRLPERGDAVCGRAIATRCFRVMQRQREALDFIRGRQNPHIENFGIGRRAGLACNSHWKAL